MDSLILELSTGFVGLKTDEIDAGVEKALARLGHYCNVDRGYLFLYRDQFSRVDNTHEWCNEGINSEIDSLQDICLSEELPWVNQTILASEVLNIPDVSKLTESAHLEKNHFEKQGIQSLLVVPVLDDENILGFLGFDSVNGYREWNQHETNLLKILANNIGLLLSRKKSELELKETKNTMDLVLNTVGSYIFMKDREYKYTYVNQKVCELFQKSSEQIIGRKDDDFFSAESIQDIKKSDTLVIDKGVGVRRDEQLVGPDGLIRHYLAIKIPIFNENNEVTSLCGVSTDITEQKKTENRYRLLADNAKDLIFRIALPEGDYEFVSNAAEKIFGYTPQEFYDSPLLIKKVIHHDWNDYFIEQWENLLQGIVPATYEYPILTKTGEQRWVNQRNTLVRDDQGKPIALEGIVTDVTERKQAEFKTQQLTENLMQKNAEQERFVYTVSHDLKSPLVTISGFCGIAKADLASGEVENCKKTLDVVLHAAKRMQRLLGDLLEVSRAGVKVDPSETFNLSVLINEAIENVSGVISDNKTEIEVDPDLPDVTVDRKYFLQVLENLVVNASKYSHSAKEGSRVRIGVIRDAEQLTCYVKDNGIGLEPQYMKKVFELFEKLDPDSDSSGVGLAIVKRIIESHGGRVWAESEGLGHGTTFFFTLPEA